MGFMVSQMQSYIRGETTTNSDWIRKDRDIKTFVQNKRIRIQKRKALHGMDAHRHIPNPEAHTLAKLFQITKLCWDRRDFEGTRNWAHGTMCTFSSKYKYLQMLGNMFTKFLSICLLINIKIFNLRNVMQFRGLPMHKAGSYVKFLHTHMAQNAQALVSRRLNVCTFNKVTANARDPTSPNCGNCVVDHDIYKRVLPHRLQPIWFIAQR